MEANFLKIVAAFACHPLPCFETWKLMDHATVKTILQLIPALCILSQSTDNAWFQKWLLFVDYVESSSELEFRQIAKFRAQVMLSHLICIGIA